MPEAERDKLKDGRENIEILVKSQPDYSNFNLNKKYMKRKKPNEST